jgi:hypothetical protein
MTPIGDWASWTWRSWRTMSPIGSRVKRGKKIKGKRMVE